MKKEVKEDESKSQINNKPAGSNKKGFLGKKNSRSSTISLVSTLASLVRFTLALMVVSSREVLPRPASPADSLATSLHGVQTRLLLLPMPVVRSILEG